MDDQCAALNWLLHPGHSATLTIAIMITMVRVVGVVLKLCEVAGQIGGACLEQVHDLFLVGMVTVVGR